MATDGTAPFSDVALAEFWASMTGSPRKATPLSSDATAAATYTEITKVDGKSTSTERLMSAPADTRDSDKTKQIKARDVKSGGNSRSKAGKNVSGSQKNAAMMSKRDKSATSSRRRIGAKAATTMAQEHASRNPGQVNQLATRPQASLFSFLPASSIITAIDAVTFGVTKEGQGSGRSVKKVSDVNTAATMAASCSSSTSAEEGLLISYKQASSCGVSPATSTTPLLSSPVESRLASRVFLGSIDDEKSHGAPSITHSPDAKNQPMKTSLEELAPSRGHTGKLAATLQSAEGKAKDVLSERCATITSSTRTIPSMSNGDEVLAETKPNKDRIARPPNSFMCFRRRFNEASTSAGKDTTLLEGVSVARTNQAQVSRGASAAWKALTDFERQKYIDEADEKAREHRLRYPDYKYTPRKKISSEQSPPATPKTARSKSMPGSSSRKVSSESVKSRRGSTSARRMSRGQSAKPQPLDLSAVQSTGLPESTSAKKSDRVVSQYPYPACQASPNFCLPMTSPMPMTPATSDALLGTFNQLLVFSPMETQTFADSNIFGPENFHIRTSVNLQEAKTSHSNGQDFADPFTSPTVASTAATQMTTHFGTLADNDFAAQQIACYTSDSTPCPEANDLWLRDLLKDTQASQLCTLSHDMSTGIGPASAMQESSTQSRASPPFLDEIDHVLSEPILPSVPQSSRGQSSQHIAETLNSCIDDFIVWPLDQETSIPF